MRAHVKSTHKNQKGAISVLVVVTLLLLMTFGLLALSATLAYEKLGARTAAWTKEIYNLDSVALQVVGSIDKALFEAETAARDDYALVANDLNFEQLYFNKAFTALSGQFTQEDGFECALSEKYTDASQLLQAGAPSVTDGDITVSFTVTEGEGDREKNLSVTISVLTTNASFSLADGKLMGGRSEGRIERYRIVEWREWQNYNQQMQSTQYWQGQQEIDELIDQYNHDPVNEGDQIIIEEGLEPF